MGSVCNKMVKRMDMISDSYDSDSCKLHRFDEPSYQLLPTRAGLHTDRDRHHCGVTDHVYYNSIRRARLEREGGIPSGRVEI